MTQEQLQEQMLLAICKPEDQRAVPYKKASDGKTNLHYWEIDQHKAANNCSKVAQIHALEEKIRLCRTINEHCVTIQQDQRQIKWLAEVFKEELKKLKG